MSQWKGAFSPRAVPALTAAFEEAWQIFLHSDDRRLENWDKTRNELAARVVELSKRGEIMEGSRLAREALAELRRRELSHH
jgi:hypothetical protein